MNLLFEEVEPVPERTEPEGGWQPACKVQDHLWKIECDAGHLGLVCVDPCSEEKLDTYDLAGMTPGCLLDAEMVGGETPPFKLKYIDDSTPSGPWGPAEYGGWFEPVQA